MLLLQNSVFNTISNCYTDQNRHACYQSHYRLCTFERNCIFLNFVRNWLSDSLAPEGIEVHDGRAYMDHRVLGPEFRAPNSWEVFINCHASWNSPYSVNLSDLDPNGGNLTHWGKSINTTDLQGVVFVGVPDWTADITRYSIMAPATVWRTLFRGCFKFETASFPYTT